jgi:hypothetical protein
MNVDRTWSRRRLLIRSVISTTLPVGWTWAAVTALIPYFWIGHGSGTSTITVLGATRATWMSLHVWSSIAMGLLTIAHVVLNRKGVGRSVRIVSGAPNKASSHRPAKRGFAWVGAALLILVTTAGGFAFAQVDNTHPSGGGGQELSQGEANSAAEGPGVLGGRGMGRHAGG